jgi:uncharacterized membrane protein YgcG
MKNVIKMTTLLLVMIVVAFGCRPEGVGPNGAKKDLPVIAGAENHPPLPEICGEAKTYQLVAADGSVNVNKCFGPGGQGYPLIPCSGNTPAWGTAILMNGKDDFVINYELSPTWVAQTEQTYFGAESSLVFDSSELPVLGQDWTMRLINPVVGKWQTRMANSQVGNQFAVSVRIVAVKLTLNGQIVPGSETVLYLKDTSAVQVVPTPSPYMASYKRSWCPDQWPAPQSVCKTVDIGAPALNGCTTLTPTITNPVGTVSYAWASGETSPSIVACSTGVSSYTVSVSDGSGPRAVYTYQINYRNVSCNGNNGGGNNGGGNHGGGNHGSGNHGNGGSGSGSGNGSGHGHGHNAPAKVYVCHIPPGNPTRRVEQCLDWSAVGAHVVAYRQGGQGHNTGCQLGRCNSNPCQ